MTGIVFAASAAEVRRKVDLRTKNRRTPDELRKKGVVVGVAEEVQQQLAALEAAGVQRVMLQWLDMDDVEGIEALAKAALT
jgi:alkanesulfonate monooxygenase SsuD/methylene tetrahydromethanopterin reductase-like flavin-dependent oxidoreductase (luciferase family)